MFVKTFISFLLYFIG